MSPRLLVLGATGRIGSLVVEALAATPPWKPSDIGGLVRDTERATPMWPSGVTAVVGEFSDPPSITAAMKGVEVVFISSPVHPEMCAWQCGAVQAAAAAGVRRIVKLSGSAWTMENGRTTTVGAAHAQVEARMRSLQKAGGPECICIRPNAFLQGMLGRMGQELESSDTFSLAIGDAQVALADIRDIAAMCAYAMCAATVPPTVEVTGPEAVDGLKIGSLLEQMLARPIHYNPTEIDDAVGRARASGMNEFTVRHQKEVLTLLREGAGSRIRSDFQNLLGQSPRTVRDFLAEVSAKVGGVAV